MVVPATSKHADPFNVLRPLVVDGRVVGQFASLPALESQGLGAVTQLPLSLRVLLESLLRHAGDRDDARGAVRALAQWSPRAARTEEIPFYVARIVAPDASGIPLLADLAAMRDRAAHLGISPARIEPRVPVDVIVDHSLQVERAGSADALSFNLAREFERNEERYAFLKWAAQAFASVRVIPPGVGIIHQVNLEYLARGVLERDGLLFPDTLVGTDSHTTMINGIGVLGWGVGGIEAEAAMLGQPVTLLMPDVVGVELTGTLMPGVTTTDLALTIVERLRASDVVAKFVEFHGAGVASLPATDRATIANMAPEYGATTAYFAVDEHTLDYLAAVGRSSEQIALIKAYYVAQGMFGTPPSGGIAYTDIVRIDLGSVVPSVAGPSRPQDRIDLTALRTRFRELLARPRDAGGFGRSAVAPIVAAKHASEVPDLRDGDIVIAAITSCANTSNPHVLIAAGLLAKKAVQRGLRVAAHVKTSFTPGSRVVDAYLRESGLQPYLDALGFQIVGHGCATCMGNSGPLKAPIEAAITRDDLVAVSVLSGNRNFEARIHPAVKANFLMSPPLVVAFAIAGRVDIDLVREMLGADAGGAPVYLRDIWPTNAEIETLMTHAADPSHARLLYADAMHAHPLWDALAADGGAHYRWNARSSYLRRPPFVDAVEAAPAGVAAIRGARALAILGDSVTTDHISPAGAIATASASGRYLRSQGIDPLAFNSYIARRANHEVMVRGTFANVRMRNLMLPGTEGGLTVHVPDAEPIPIHEAAALYAEEGVPLIVIAGELYGIGSSRDWAAKGPWMLGVRAVIARSFERIHRSNLVGMGIVPCEFTDDDSAQSLQLTGRESFDILDIDAELVPRQAARLRIVREDGSTREVVLRVRVDTPVEAAYFRHGGILPFVLRQMMEPERAA
ncbi:MAG TPA: aconitate hydratase AcnA [Casimicrobiaceae bacterium]|jgi:aconitate hydratase|nr:aconitate hydratase AcnA [Casimicrobiaceae bacterium]